MMHGGAATSAERGRKVQIQNFERKQMERGTEKREERRAVFFLKRRKEKNVRNKCSDRRERESVQARRREGIGRLGRGEREGKKA